MTTERILYWYQSFHPQKVRLAINALELPHTLHRVDLGAGLGEVGVVGHAGWMLVSRCWMEEGE